VKLKLRTGDGFAVVAPLEPFEGGLDLFLFCRDDRWTSNYHLIWSNAGNYLTTLPSNVRITCVRLRRDFDPPVATPELFDIRNLDSTWSYFQTVAGTYLLPDSGNRLAMGTPLNGSGLFRCTPGRCTTRYGR
jgi:hypothetical protein